MIILNAIVIPIINGKDKLPPRYDTTNNIASTKPLKSPRTESDANASLNVII